MKRINVKAYEKALVFENGKLINVLPSGKHWVWFSHSVKIYDVTKIINQESNFDLLLKNDLFASLINIIIVKDNEIMLQYKDELFHNVLSSGKYCYWKQGIDFTYKRIDLNNIDISEKIDRKVLKDAKVCPYYCMYNVESFEKGILYIDGKYIKEVSTGIHYYWNGEKTAIIKKVDMRKQQLEISGQELLTKDKAAIRLNFFCNYKVLDAKKILDETKDYVRQLYIMIQLGIREYVGQYTLDDLLANKESATTYILTYAKDKAIEMGVDLVTCGIRDVVLPGDVREIMNQVLIAEKKAQANVIMRREETASTRSLLNTAKLMEDNDMLFRLKEMEYMEKISERVGQITLNGGNQIMDQLRGLVSGKK